MTRGRWALGIGLTLLGAVLIASGFWLTRDTRSFESEAVLQFGATLLLVIPLLFLERLFERRVEGVRAETSDQIEGVQRDVADLRSETSAEIGTLKDAIEARLKERRDEDARAVEEASGEVTYERIGALFERAEELNALSLRGIRVRLEGLLRWIHFRHAYLVDPDGSRVGTIALTLQGADGRARPVSAIWSPGEHVTDVLARFAESWQSDGSYPGAGAISADALFADLIQAMEIAIRSRTGDLGRLESLAPLIELPTSDWAITDFGLEHVVEPMYGISADNIVGDPNRRQHMNDKTWVQEHQEAFDESFEAAQRFFEVAGTGHRRFVVGDSPD